MPNDDDDLIASPEAAAILGVSASTVHRMVHDGDLTPAQRIRAGRSGTFLFHRRVIEALRDGSQVDRGEPAGLGDGGPAGFAPVSGRASPPP